MNCSQTRQDTQLIEGMILNVATVREEKCKVNELSRSLIDQEGLPKGGGKEQTHMPQKLIPSEYHLQQCDNKLGPSCQGMPTSYPLVIVPLETLEMILCSASLRARSSDLIDSGSIF